MSKIEEYKQLIYLFYNKEASLKDIERLESLKEDVLFQSAWEEVWLESAGDREISSVDTERFYLRIMEDCRLEFKAEKRLILGRHQRLVVGAVASLLLCIASVLWLSRFLDYDNASIAALDTSGKINPGSDRATIILDDGRQIHLDKIIGDTVINLDGFSIVKSKEGQLYYHLNESRNGATALSFNTIVTPKGGEYRLKLPDGTEVWLNASTTLRYPIVFSPNERVVDLEGEAYFDVETMTRGKTRLPFIVNTGRQRLEVLGTQFNVNSYNTEVVTTLIEGEVKLTYPSVDLGSKVLKPNDQAIYDSASQRYIQRQVDPLYTIAWKTGDFAFDNASLPRVMEDIARWYDVEIHYKGNFDNVYFSGAISRYSDIDKLLQAIALSGGFTFKIKGKEVFIME